jgi:hypothetical protein
MRELTDPFFQYPTTPFETSTGQVELPILYFDTRNYVAMFWLDFGAAQRVMSEPGLQLVRFDGNRALATVACFEYRDTTVGAYNEVGVALAVMPRGLAAPRWPLMSLYRSPDKRQIGFHILDLPVTTEAACAAGREIWGYPKFITPISFEHGSQGFDSTVEDPIGEGSIMRLAGTGGFGLPAPPLNLVLYSRRPDEKLVRAVVNVRGRVRCQRPGSVRLQVGRSQHPMAQRLRALGLEGARPMVVQHTDAFQSRLNAGAPLPGQPPTASAMRDAT